MREIASTSALSIIILITSLLAHHVAGWGATGHRAVAYLAFNYLSPDTTKYLTDILENYPPYDISDAATWADQVRHSRPYTEGWHFIDARDSPPNSCFVQYPQDCGSEDEGCVISAIANQTSLFISPDTSSLTRKEALRYLLHFVGDIHQPLHAENAYRGGNQIKVCFRKACAHNNLHSVWDTYIPHKILGLSTSPSQQEERTAAKSWADELYSDSPQVLSAECSDVLDPDHCTIGWAEESNALVCSYVMTPGLDWLKSNDLSLEYYDGAKPIVEAQISKAGARLAAWLEAVVREAQSQAAASRTISNPKGAKEQQVLGMK